MNATPTEDEILSKVEKGFQFERKNLNKKYRAKTEKLIKNETSKLIEIDSNPWQYDINEMKSRIKGTKKQISDERTRCKNCKEDYYFFCTCEQPILFNISKEDAEDDMNQYRFYRKLLIRDEARIKILLKRMRYDESKLKMQNVN